MQYTNTTNRTYICGPITGLTEESVRTNFRLAEQNLKNKGLTPISPLNNGLPWDAPWTEHVKASLKMMLDCNSLFVLKGWENSNGCNLEINIAKKLGMPVSYEQDN